MRKATRAYGRALGKRMRVLELPHGLPNWSAADECMGSDTEVHIEIPNFLTLTRDITT